MEGVSKRRQFFVLHFLLKLECDPQEIISREICLHSRRPLSDLMGPETKTSRDLVARSAVSRPKRLASLAKRSTCSKDTYIRTFSTNWNWYAITNNEKTRMWRSLLSSSLMIRLPIFGKAKPRQQELLALKMGMRLDKVINSLLHSRSLCRHATKNSCGADYAG